MGPSVKFVSPNKGLISKKKWGSIFLFGKMTKPGGGSEGGLAKDHTFSCFFFEPFPKQSFWAGGHIALNVHFRSQARVGDDKKHGISLLCAAGHYNLSCR